MRKVRRYFNILLVILLMALPIKVYGAEKSQMAVADLKASVKKGVEPKKSQSLKPSDFPLAHDGDYIGSLEDDFGYHYIWFDTISDYKTNQMDFRVTYQSDYDYLKDSIVDIEFYKESNNVLDFDGYTEFDTMGESSLSLHSYMDQSDFVNQPYLYVRVGISEYADDEYYTDVMAFKVKNPYYQNYSDPGSNPEPSYKPSPH